MKKAFRLGAVRARVLVLSAVCAVGGLPVFAQRGDAGNQVISTVNTQLRGMFDSIVQLLQIILGIGALVTLVMVLFQVFKGEREAASKIAWWVAGLAVGFVLITVVKNIVMT